MQAQKPTLQQKVAGILRQASPTAALVLINGFVIAVIAYFALYFAAVDIRNQEAARVTRDVLVTTEQSIAATEKSLRGLAVHLAGASSETISARISSAKKFLPPNQSFSGLLWSTDRYFWYYEDLQHGRAYGRHDPASGLPDYKDLYRATFGQAENTIGYIMQMPWLVGRTTSSVAPVNGNIGLTVKTRMADGSNAILFVMVAPRSLFGLNNVLKERPDIIGLSITDLANNTLISDTSPAANANSHMVEVKYPLALGDRGLEIVFSLYPSILVRIMLWAPMLVAAFLIMMSTALAWSIERKHKQDLQIAEMSRNLQGAHSELKTSQGERDKLFHTLRKSERENRAVLNSVSDIIFETDETGKVLFVNETWKRISGREIDDAVGNNLFGMIDPADRMRQREMFEELVRGERQAYRIETRLDIASQVMKPVEIAFSMLRLSEDKSLRVVGTITDIEKRRRAELAVREAEQRYRAMFENSTSGIYQSSLEGRYINANPAMAEILGYGSAQELMDHVRDISADVYVDPADSKAFAQKLMFEGRVSGMEIQVKRRDGRKIWIMENARVVRNERGGVQYFEGSITDVTERREAEEAMRHARLQAEMSSRSRMEFLANMSHELRTPLNAIIGFSEIIKDEIMGKHEIPVYKEYAQDIYESGNYLLKVISEILEVSKIETGNRDLAITNFRLAKAVNACMTIMGSRIDEAKVKVTSHLPADLPELMAEELGFKQIMLNLVGNAIKFTPEGGTVDIVAHIGDDREMIIDVIDTGIGMTPDEIVKAMQPFSKVDNNFSSMKAGTGLGLTIVDSLVRLHGGEFKLISEKGKGTTARIIMPAHRVYHLTDDGRPALVVVG